MLLLEIQDHGFILCCPRVIYKEFAIFVLFCNRTLALLFQNETLALRQYQITMTRILA
jgi:hypothetical protein